MYNGGVSPHNRYFSVKHVHKANVRKHTQSYVTEILQGAIIKTLETFNIDTHKMKITFLTFLHRN